MLKFEGVKITYYRLMIQLMCLLILNLVNCSFTTYWFCGTNLDYICLTHSMVDATVTSASKIQLDVKYRRNR